jgi:hypothetical protein
MIILKICFYISESGRSEISTFINKLSQVEKSYVLAIFNKIRTEGLEFVDTRQIEGKVWEIKTYRFNRFFYFIKDHDQILIFYALKKQKNKLENHDRRLIIDRYNRLK